MELAKTFNNVRNNPVNSSIQHPDTVLHNPE
jgi:hypothetical protein